MANCGGTYPALRRCEEKGVRAQAQAQSKTLSPARITRSRVRHCMREDGIGGGSGCFRKGRWRSFFENISERLRTSTYESQPVYRVCPTESRGAPAIECSDGEVRVIVSDRVERDLDSRTIRAPDAHSYWSEELTSRYKIPSEV